MLIDYWTRFGETTLWTGIGWAITLSFFFYIVMHWVYRNAVSGTRRSYQSVTIVKTLLWPLFGAYVFSVDMDLFTQEWISALIDAWICSIFLRDWERIKDKDDWWKGKGTKLKRKLKSLFTSTSPATSDAAA
jgi:pheromone shutdown protein TraB